MKNVIEFKRPNLISYILYSKSFKSSLDSSTVWKIEKYAIFFHSFLIKEKKLINLIVKLSRKKDKQKPGNEYEK